MTDDQMDDIKQFFEATVHQTEVRLVERIEGVEQQLSSVEQELGSVEQELKDLRQEMHDGFAGVADVIDSHEDRITKLEEKAAA